MIGWLICLWRGHDWFLTQWRDGNVTRTEEECKRCGKSVRSVYDHSTGKSRYVSY